MALGTSTPTVRIKRRVSGRRQSGCVPVVQHEGLARCIHGAGPAPAHPGASGPNTVTWVARLRQRHGCRHAGPMPAPTTATRITCAPGPGPSMPARTCAGR